MCTSTPWEFRSVMASPSICLTADRGGVTSQATSHSATRMAATFLLDNASMQNTTAHVGVALEGAVVGQPGGGGCGRRAGGGGQQA